MRTLWYNEPMLKKNKKYIVYINGILWDKVWAPDWKAARSKARARVRRIRKMNPDHRRDVQVESLSTFLHGRRYYKAGQKWANEQLGRIEVV